MLKVYTGNRLENLLLQMDTNIKSDTASPLEKNPPRLYPDTRYAEVDRD